MGRGVNQSHLSNETPITTQKEVVGRASTTRNQNTSSCHRARLQAPRGQKPLCLDPALCVSFQLADNWYPLIFSNDLKNLVNKCSSLSLVSWSSKLIKPKQVLGTPELWQVGQKHMQQPGLKTGFWSGGVLVGLSPLPVESDSASR